jgi:ankyrin repeat protein
MNDGLNPVERRFLNLIETNNHRLIVYYALRSGTVRRFIRDSLPYCIDDPRVSLDTIDILVHLGADPHIKNYGETNYNIVNYLCHNDGRIDAIKHLVRRYRVDVNDRSATGETPLVGAVLGARNYGERLDLVAFLLNHGADPLIEDDMKMTPRQILLRVRNEGYYENYFEGDEFEMNYEKAVDAAVADLLETKENELRRLRRQNRIPRDVRRGRSRSRSPSRQH